MRIIGLWKYVEDKHLTEHTLKNCAVVIDGQNLFYNKYKESGLPYVFGSESDRYAQYLRDYMKMFVKANVKCYIIFKGGHEDMDKKFKSIDDKNHVNGESFVLGNANSDIVLPVFMKSIYKEVLDELAFDYVICEFESKRECIAFAQKHGHPVVSFDAEYCFSGVPYIPSTTLKYNDIDNSISCGLFLFDKFLKHYPGLNEDKLAMFIVLTDQKIFEANYFINYLKSIKIPLNNYLRISRLLTYLSKNPKDKVTREISRFMKFQDERKFIKAEEKVKTLIKEKIPGSLPTEYLDNSNKLQITQNDPDWFIKGVISKCIAIPYVNLYHSNVMLGSGAIASNEHSDPLLLSLDIIQYAYDLLTDFQNEGFEIVSQQSWLIPNTRGDKNNLKARSIKKPHYEAEKCVFENGWNEIRSLGLLEHFLRESLTGIDLKMLEKFPDDGRLLALALTYFSKKRHNDILTVVPSVLLCYIMLNVVFNKVNTNNDGYELLNKAINKDITKADCKVAADILSGFFETTDSETRKIFDRKRIHPLVEFQHCLEELNFLNKLCGSPYKPTKYCKTFNGTFCYKVIHTVNKEYKNNGLEFVRTKLESAKTVLALFNDLFGSFEKILKSNETMTRNLF